MGCLLRLAPYLPILTLFIVLFSIREPFPTLNGEDAFAHALSLGP